MGVFLVILIVIAGFVVAHLLKRIRDLESSLNDVTLKNQQQFHNLEAHLKAHDQALAELRLTAQPVAIAPEFEPMSKPEPEAAPKPPISQPQPVPPELPHIPPPPPIPAVPTEAPLPPRYISASVLPEFPPSAPEPAHAPSLEERFGTNWLNKLGIVILVIGLALFLAVRLKDMGPAGKVATGLTISLALLGGGLWLERKQPYRIFARAGIGGGWALLFFTTFAMQHFDATRVIDSLALDLVLMLLVAAAMVLHSLRYNAQTVTGLAFLLGYATVATSHFEAASGTVVFSLIASAILALGLVIVTTRRHWAWLELAGLIGILANHFLWLSLVMPHATSGGTFAFFAPSTALILFYYALFRAAYLLRKPLDPNEDRISSLSAIILAAGVLGLLKYQSHHPEWAFRALLSMGVIELALGIWSRPRRRNAFLVLTTIGVMLLAAAIPFQFHGVSWPLIWIVQAHVLALCGLRLGEPLFRRLGLLIGVASSLVLAIHNVLPILTRRLEATDLSHHPQLAISLALAAMLFWLHAELYPRRWPEIHAQLGDLESLALKITSWLGLASAATAIWIAFPTTLAPWIAPCWLSLVLLLGLIADWKKVPALALQSDALTGASLIALISWDFIAASQGVALLPASISIALIYLGMRRSSLPHNAPAYVAPTYSWIATLLLLFTLEQRLAEEWLALAWAIPAILLFELGRFFGKPYLRWQGIVASVLAAGALQTHWLWSIFHVTTVHGWFAAGWPNIAGILLVIPTACWIQERTRQTPGTQIKSFETRTGIFLGAVATIAIAAWLPLLAPSWGSAEAEPILWSLLASALLITAFVVHRRVFQPHAILAALLPVLYGAYMLVSGSASQAQLPWWQTNLARMSISSAILLAGLPIAFRLRKPWSENESWSKAPAFLRRPEQWFFFVPYALMIATLATELRSGSITLGWSLLALAAFITGLLIGERTFRLGGLALLLLSVVKILLMDIWTLSQTDRYITLIVLGCALLAVSFLYTRFRQTFRRLL
jgi:uncharacterized membrane protein